LIAGEQPVAPHGQIGHAGCPELLRPHLDVEPATVPRQRVDQAQAADGAVGRELAFDVGALDVEGEQAVRVLLAVHRDPGGLAQR
jgi:hypothetical protein